MTIVVVGSVNSDQVLTGERIPRPGETRTLRSLEHAHGGKGANQAAVAASLGADVRLVAAVGDDAAGRAALRELERTGVDVSGVALVPASTGLAVILVDDAGENAIGILPGANGLLSPGLVGSALDDIADHDVVLVVSLEIPLDSAIVAAQSARARGWRVVLNPAPARALPPELFAACDVVTPNAGEAAELGGAELLLAAGAGAVVVTRGGEGASWTDTRGTASREAISARVVDTTGAGDAFTAGLAVALDDGSDLDGAVAFALVCGAIATEGAGARGSLPTRAAVLARVPGRGERDGVAAS